MLCAMVTIESTIRIAAPATRVFEVYGNVPGWSHWDPDTREAHLSQGLALGSRGRLRPRRGLPVRMEVTELTPGRSFTVTCPVLGSRMHFDHVIDAAGSGVDVTHRVRFEGWLAGWLDRTVGRDVRAGLPVTLASLKRHVEAGGSAG